MLNDVLAEVKDDIIFYDFKENTLQIYPGIQSIYVASPLGRKELTIKVFFWQDTANKLCCVANHLMSTRRHAQITCKDLGGLQFSLGIIMEVEDFPISRFIRFFDQKKIIEKGIREIKVTIYTKANLEAEKEDFHFPSRQFMDCGLSIGSFMPPNYWVAEDEMTRIPVDICCLSSRQLQ